MVGYRLIDNFSLPKDLNERLDCVHLQGAPNSECINSQSKASSRPSL